MHAHDKQGNVSPAQYTPSQLGKSPKSITKMVESFSPCKPARTSKKLLSCDFSGCGDTRKADRGVNTLAI